jgi:hypothetical protein
MDFFTGARTKIPDVDERVQLITVEFNRLKRKWLSTILSAAL